MMYFLSLPYCMQRGRIQEEKDIKDPGGDNSPPVTESAEIAPATAGEKQKNNDPFAAIVVIATSTSAKTASAAAVIAAA